MNWINVALALAVFLVYVSIQGLLSGIGDDLWFLLKRRSRLVRSNIHVTIPITQAITIEVVNSEGKVVTLPPLRPDDKVSIRTFVREAEKATGEQQYASPAGSA